MPQLSQPCVLVRPVILKSVLVARLQLLQRPATVLQYCKHGSHSTLTAMARFQQVKVTTRTRSHFLPVALLKLAHVSLNMSRPYSITAWVPVVR